MSDVRSTLFKVQEYELQVDEARSRLDEIKAELSKDALLQAAQTAVGAAQDVLRETSGEVRRLELELQSLADKISDVNTMLFDGSITNPKELQERQDEVESLERRKDVLQYQLENANQEADMASDNLESAEERLQTITAERAEANTALLKEQDKLNAIVKKTLKQRKTLISDLPDPVLKQFRLLRKIKGQAIAPLNGNSCGVCGIEQPSSEVQRIITTEELIHCIGCGRIIISNF